MLTRSRGAIRLAIVQHDALLRDLLRIALAQGSGLEVAGVFEDGGDLLREIAAVRPHVALLDMDPACHNGVQLALKLRRALPELGIVLLVTERDGGLLASVPGHELQSWSYLVNKTQHGVTALLRAIQVTHARLLDLTDVDPQRPAAPLRSAAARPTLTERQREILGLIADGLTNRAIADALRLKEKTIENQVAAIYDKLDQPDDRGRVHLRVWAAMHYGRTMRPETGPAAETAPGTEIVAGMEIGPATEAAAGSPEGGGAGSD